jgi:type II secretory ATPase GspE/PulE/Tfp pilus assembly ATPase PilB-like protein
VTVSVTNDVESGGQRLHFRPLAASLAWHLTCYVDGRSRIEQREDPGIVSTISAPAPTQVRSQPPRPLKFDYLIAQRFITREQLRVAMEEAREQQASVESLLMTKYSVLRSHVGMSLSLFYRCAFVGLDSRVLVDPELLKGLSVQRLRAGCWIPTRSDGDTVTVVMKDPHDLPAVDSIERLFSGRRIKLAVGLPEEILRLIDASFNGTDTKSILGELSEVKVEAEEDADIAGGLEVSDSDGTIIRLAHQIILDAYRSRASDIHIEPCHLRKQAIVRFRVDGSCLEYERIPGHLGKPLVARFKIMAHLDIAERRKPQDGKLRVRLPEREIELRIATIPTVGGNEDAILRLLPAQDVIPLDRQGLSERNLREIKGIAQKPYGLVLCVGPTGSGKTTTLHAILSHINTPDRKIWTAEDPVEITQPGLRQVQVRPKIGYTFAAAMRAFLRGDPDVIMVGEMRDAETAAIAIEAALTGHLVLSTLHTNSAAETVVRLLDFGLDPFNFADALLGVLAQRLVKRVCADCAQPAPAELDELIRAYGPEEFAGLGLDHRESIQLFHGKGCDTCKQTGYRGRAAIHELLVASDEIKSMIVTRQRVPEILAQARREGMTTLVQDGIVKVLNGITDFRQVKAVAIR